MINVYNQGWGTGYLHTFTDKVRYHQMFYSGYFSGASNTITVNVKNIGNTTIDNYAWINISSSATISGAQLNGSSWTAATSYSTKYWNITIASGTSKQVRLTTNWAGRYGTTTNTSRTPPEATLTLSNTGACSTGASLITLPGAVNRFVYGPSNSGANASGAALATKSSNPTINLRNEAGASSSAIYLDMGQTSLAPGKDVDVSVTLPSTPIILQLYTDNIELTLPYAVWVDTRIDSNKLYTNGSWQ